MIATRTCCAAVLMGVCLLLSAGRSYGSLYSDEFGQAVSVRSGLTIVGSRADNDHTWSGAAYIFNTATGDQVRYLTASDGYEFQGFGAAVSVDGLVAVVGAGNDNEAAGDGGAAYVYSTSTGAEMHKLMADDASLHSYLGSSVSVSGTRVLAGARGADGLVADTGAAYVFDAMTGTQLRKLTPSDGAADDQFGATVALSGNLAVVGAHRHDGGGSLDGAAYVFDVTTGEQLYKLTPSIDAGLMNDFGFSVAVDGNLAVVGAPGADLGYTGAAYVYDLTTGDELFKLTDPGGYDQGFGRSVAVSGDRAIVGAPYNSDLLEIGGTASVFDLTTGDFLYSLMAPSPRPGGLFGYAVGLDGDTAVIGAPYSDPYISIPEDPVYEEPGRAYVFDLTGPAHTQTLTGPGVVGSGEEFDPDLCQYYDFDGDGDIDEDDFVYMIEHLVQWSRPGGESGIGTKRGDFNLDGLVNGTDLAIMKTWFGTTGVVYSQGNANCDDLVNATDLAILKTNFGFAAPTGAVPEPISLSLLALGVGGILAHRRRR